MIFTGLTAPLSYAYRMIFGWCSSNAPLGFKESPSHSQWISFRVTWRSSSGVSGQWKALRSSRFIRLQNPDPSHWRIFIEVRRRLQNATCSVSMGRGEILIWWWRPDHCNFFSDQWLRRKDIPLFLLPGQAWRCRNPSIDSISSGLQESDISIRILSEIKIRTDEDSSESSFLFRWKSDKDHILFRFGCRLLFCKSADPISHSR